MEAIPGACEQVAADIDCADLEYTDSETKQQPGNQLVDILNLILTFEKENEYSKILVLKRLLAELDS